MNDSKSGAARFEVTDHSDLMATVHAGGAAQSLLAPLFPAEPPAPRSARLVTFDDEQLSERRRPPERPAMALPQARYDSLRRERAARRAARRSSLFSAARF